MCKIKEQMLGYKVRNFVFLKADQKKILKHAFKCCIMHEIA